MRFRYCPDCGARLSARVLGDEGEVPWCDSCSRPWFDMFPAAVIALVHNEEGEVLLLRQDYILTEFHNLVSGYITPGEDAETCARREIAEETGLEVERLELVLTNWFPKKDMLMVGFFAEVKKRPLRLSGEVDSAAWYRSEEIPALLSPRPWSTSRILASRYLERLSCRK